MDDGLGVLYEMNNEYQTLKPCIFNVLFIKRTFIE